MNYILTMTLSGSGMLFLYFILKFAFGKRIPKTCLYFLLKAVMLYYLIPLPFLGALYHKIYRYFTNQASSEIIHFYSEDKIIYQTDHLISISPGYERKLLSGSLWLLGALIVFALWIACYLSYRSKLLYRMNQYPFSHFEFTAQNQNLPPVRQKITVYACTIPHLAFTIGILKPIIFCSFPENSLEGEMLLHHELVHIKRRDALWKAVGILAWRLHWCNPLIYLFLKEFYHICEESCDELVIKERNQEERFLYASLLVKYSYTPSAYQSYETALSENAEQIKKRALSIMDSKTSRLKKRSLAPTIIACMAILLNSTTVFAYDEVKIWSNDVMGSSGLSPWQADAALTSSAAWDSQISGISYEIQFTDGQGKIISLQNSDISPSHCHHAYTAGISAIHVKQPESGCRTYRYNSFHCSICGDISWGSFSLCVYLSKLKALFK
ncbi:MAG: M56 family metallopeptidase [Bacteroidales bacterium]|nr:M56 family metallopeptidase [Lachnoclostridium sp.]MCM1383781.1 M56 family metallopeptidase [Lachnoclostridium sp.]MCM1464409.1 M56 family metallopeptidase [Bacteroidales bacterium]